MSRSTRKLGKKLGKKVAEEKKSGRPPLPKGKVRDTLTTFRLTELEKQILTDYCWRYGQSPSFVIRDALAILGVIPDW